MVKEGSLCCGAVDPQGFACTEPPGHKGDHIARDIYEYVCARWPNVG